MAWKFARRAGPGSSRGLPLCRDTKTLEIEVCPRVGSKARCSTCRRPGVTCDHLGACRCEFVPFWDLKASLLWASQEHPASRLVIVTRV